MIRSSSQKFADGRGHPVPIGRQLHVSSKAVGHAFNAALAEVGGSLSTWLVLSALEHDQWHSQNDLAAGLGIEGPTLTRHLDALERSGLVVRVRDSADRRVVRVETTAAGRELHKVLLEAALAFDRRLRAGLTKAEVDELRRLLAKLESNVGPEYRAAPRQM